MSKFYIWNYIIFTDNSATPKSNCYKGKCIELSFEDYKCRYSNQLFAILSTCIYKCYIFILMNVYVLLILSMSELYTLLFVITLSSSIMNQEGRNV